MLLTENDTRPECHFGPLDGSKFDARPAMILMTETETGYTFHRYTLAPEDDGSTFFRYDGAFGIP